MNPSTKKGNNPELWDKLLSHLDDKLQFGLLDHLRRVTSYHFEEEILYIEPGSDEDTEYLTKDPVLQQLQLMAQDALKVVEKVKLKKKE